MTLRFEVNQAEAFRRGVDVPKSTVHLEVDPSALSQQDRDLIADRLNGIDVCELCVNYENVITKNAFSDGTKARIVSTLPTYDALIEAIKQNDTKVKDEISSRK
jgi:hypothetical protein